MSHDEARKIRLIMSLRGRGIVSSAVLGALERVPRELFVDPAFLDQAWEDRALPIAAGQTVSQPFVVAFMTQALELTDRTKVLEIGTGSGYQAAILARIARRVYTVERHAELLQVAERRFAELKLHNLHTRHGDGWKGWAEQAPFEAIIVTAAASEPPQALLDQLADGGRMVVPVGNTSDVQRLVRFRRHGDRIEEEKLLDVRFVPLVRGAARADGTQ
ncbi:MAG: protein-L-isoaspartate(D-aspartate) O-methyltransferase [Thalassobaculum sp.]|uniref:protein-L-isoaspartate(D-aspartate) O-methyltransferase n=1 Tax=Thalassobaculum sp. TaxID=2022740 RepID=UPI0032EC8371